MLDNRIPRAAVGAPTGAAELRYGGAATERGAGALVEGGGDGFALHADGFWRRTDDLRVPAFNRPTDAGSERRTRIVNSASRADGGALGGSLVWDHGFLGASVDSYRNTYGTVAEEDVKIHMQRDKLAVAGELRKLGGPFRNFRGQLQSTDFQHQEVEGTGEVGTTFKNKGTDGRFELEHAPLSLGAGNLRGVLGNLAPQWQLSTNLAYTERAPTYAELFANGVHIATSAFERGSANNGKEKAGSIDMALQWKVGDSHARLGAFASRFSNYITLAATGEPTSSTPRATSFPSTPSPACPRACRAWSSKASGAC